MRFLCVLILLAVAGFTNTACDKCKNGIVDPSCNINETFTGTVPVSTSTQIGVGVSKFHVSENGEYFVTLNSLTPPLASNQFTDVQVTAQISGQCVLSTQIVGNNNASQAGKQVLSGTISPGDFCLWVVDEGIFSVPETYSITINHP